MADVIKYFGFFQLKFELYNFFTQCSAYYFDKTYIWKN